MRDNIFIKKTFKQIIDTSKFILVDMIDIANENTDK